MKIRIYSRYVLLGLSLALMLQTNYRIAGSVGIGELLAIVYFVLVGARQALVGGQVQIRRPDDFTLFYSAVVVLVITPMTLLSLGMNTQGSSFRDLISYFFTCAVLLVLPRADRDVHTMVMTFLVVLFATIGFQFFWGDSSAYYFLRFTGGAKNPNQLALFLVVAVAFSACLPSATYRIGVVLLSLFFGIASSSDAYLVFVLVSILGFTTLIVLPPRAVVFALPLLLVMTYIAFISTGISEVLVQEWAVADEGDLRTQLWLFAFQAWIDSPLSFVFGHGAGSFSGIAGPFGMAEAHNTILDLATVGGTFGLLLFPALPLWMIVKSLSKNHRFAPAVFMGLIAYACFHFVGRQPVFWVSIVLLSRLILAEWDRKRLASNAKPIINGASA